MIVDDEAEVREGIAHKIDWASLGFEVVAEAENGLEALEKAESMEVDLLLTDIKMPFMDGLTMVGEFSLLHPSAKVIIFSGFDDMDYARQAIKLGVAEYVLKPVNAEELTDILKRIKRTLDRENDEKRDIEQLRNQYLQNLPAARDRFLGDLLWRRIPREAIPQGLREYSLPIDDTPHKLVLVFDISFRKSREPSVDRDLVQISMEKIIRETFSERCRYALIFGFSQLVAITAWDEADPVSKAVLLGNDICMRCKRILEIHLVCGIGYAYSDLYDTHNAYTEARAALEYHSILGTERAIYIGDMEQEKAAAALDNHGEKRLLTAIKFGTEQQITDEVDTLLQPLRQMDPTGWEIRAYVMEILSMVFQIVWRNNLYSEQRVTERTRDAYRFTEAGFSLEQFQGWLSELCLCMGGYLVERRMSAGKLLVTEALRYIKENYADPTLSVERLCEHLHVSASYFSSVFKQETGQSYVQHLTETRMMEALRLLRETDEKTYVIAAKVGYEDPNYFSYAFRKHFGGSPSKFRG